MPTTTNYGWVTPGLGDEPNAPEQFQDLADEIDADLKAEETARIAGDAMVASSRTHTTGSSIASGSIVLLNFNVSESNDIPWDNTNSRFTLPTAGYYQINSGVQFASNATGVRTVQIRVNGSVIAEGQIAAGSAQVGPTVSRCKYLAASDLVTVHVFQNSGVALLVQTTAGKSYVDITRVGL